MGRRPPIGGLRSTDGVPFWAGTNVGPQHAADGVVVLVLSVRLPWQAARRRKRMLRRLLLLALLGMALSKLYFGSPVPPDLRFKAPGFSAVRDRAKASKPRSSA